MTPDAIRRLFPNASRSVIAANAGHPELFKLEERARRKEADAPVRSSELERHSATRTMGPPKTQGRDTASFLVRVTSVRRRLIDEDNLCIKYCVDCARYASLVPGDSPAEVRIEARQRKAAKGEEERTIVEIYALAIADYAMDH